MHLYILTRTVNIDVSDITLNNGCVPVVGGLESFEDKGLSVEPAIWFKVLVIDAVSIDCTQRQISWSSVSSVSLDFKGSDSGIGACGSYCSTDDGVPSGDMPHLTRSISESTFDCGECFSYDRDLDEVFDTVPTLVSDYRTDLISTEKFHERLMHLLHVFVLPSIKLGCEDINNVADCLKKQDVYLQEVDKKILALSENLEKRRRDRKVQRKKFINEIQNSSSRQMSYARDLLKVLVDDIALDVTEAWETFERAQREVDRCKGLPVDVCDPKLLQSKRVHRDQLLHDYENLLSVREKLRDMLKDSVTRRFRIPFRGNPVETPESALGSVYLCLTKGEQEKASKIKDLTDKKLLMLSVKEAMRTTLDELLKGEESFGIDMDRTGSMKATNVLNSLAASTVWQTLAEQVAKVIGNTDHDLAKMHFKFCAEVNGRCLRAIEESKLQSRSSSQSTLCIRGSGQSGSSEQSTSSGSLETSLSKDPIPANEPPVNCVDDWVLKSNVSSIPEETRDSVVSGNSCSLNPSRNSLPVNIRDSCRSDISVMSDSSNVMSEPDNRVKVKKKGKVKKPSKKSIKSTFHSYVSDGQTSSQDEKIDDTIQPQKDDRREIDKVLELITSHFEVMCVRLQQELDLTHARYHRKVWLNYESHFYQETMDNLIQLYQWEYSSITEALCQSVKTLTITDLSLDDALLSHMLQDVNERCDVPSPVHSSSSTLKSNQSAKLFQGDNPLLKLLRNKSNTPSVDQPGNRISRLFPDGSCSETLADATQRDSDIDVPPDPSVCALRRRLSELPSRPKTVRLSLNVQYPKSGVIVYERVLCPIRNSVLIEGGTTACGTSPLADSNLPASRSGSTSSDLPEEEGLCKSKTTQLKPKYKKQFALVFRRIDSAITTRCPSAKFQHLTKCLREVSHQISVFYQEVYGRSVGACADELMDALVILLCNVDGTVLSQLYCQIMILADIIPPFFNGSPFSFALVQFVGACQFIQERIMLKKNRNSY